MKTGVALDLKRITSEVAARHGMLVMPDDPAMLLVTMNELVLEQVLGSLEARVEEIIAGFEDGLRSAQKEALRNIEGEARKLGLLCARKFKRILTPGGYTRAS
jgi:hypothetical protein